MNKREAQPTLLSRFVYSPLNYWGSLVGDCLMAVIYLATGLVLLATGASRGALAIPALLAGWLFWSLLEYVLHRYILHGPKTLAQEGHAHHHREERTLLASPLFVIPLFELLVWWLLSLVLGRMLAAFFVAGAASGYASFSLLHHIFHHHSGAEKSTTTGRGVWASLRKNHEVHHQLARYNFGTTTSLWDRVFGTYRRSSTIKS